MRKVLLAGILVAAVAMAAPAMAFEKGTIRLGAGTGVFSTGAGFSTTSRDFDSGGGPEDIDTLAIGGGYFLTDVVELGLEYANIDLDGNDISTIGLNGRYYFPMGENSLFAGGGFRLVDIGQNDGSAIFVTGGYNYMLRDYFSIDFYLTLGQGDLDGDDFNLTDIGITYSVYFK
jgi:hypothetical protein